MTWAFKRQALYVFILILFIGVFAFLIIYSNTKKPPSCTDNKQNGNETGIDCGGSCLRACLAQVDEVSILWARSFRVVPGRYNAVAYLENHNKNTAIKKINYRFRFADANNIYIGKREGSTFIPPSGKFAVFEPGIDVGNSIPVYTSFEFTQIPEWTTVSPEKQSQLQVLVSNIALANEDANPKLSATIRNGSFFLIPEMSIVVILYDKNRNAVSASSTYLSNLAGEEERSVNFTWPEPMSAKIVAKEIIPIFNIFSVKFK
ncbi:MAG: hypothetical protein AAB933_01745 [Patescibacteria group bacterium]